MTNLKTFRSFILLSTVSAAAMASVGPVAAQDDVDDAADDDVIVVTGSRIAKPDYAYSNPVVSVDAEAIQYSGQTNITDLLQELPALTSSRDTSVESGSNETVGGAGVNVLDLRSLGTDRTLVLVNGRRHVAARPGSASVDTNTIPIDLVERVEIATGGASAIYGADGVTGVVNFVMKRDFEGIAIRGQAGLTTDEGDADQQQISFVVGQNFNDDRGNIALAFEFNNSERLPASARDFAGGGARLQFVDNPGLVPGQEALQAQFGTATFIPLNDIGFNDSSPDSAVYVTPDFGIDFNGTGLPFDAGSPFFIPPFLQQGGDGSSRDRFIGDLLSGQKRYNANLLANYQLTDNHRVFGAFKYVRTETETQSQPSFDFFMAISEDNPFIPAAIRTQLDATPLTLSEAFGGPRGVLVSRDHFEAVRGSYIERETMRGEFGFEGEIFDNVDYSLSYVYGQSKVEDLAINNRFNDRLAAALDAVIDPMTGQPTCRSNLDPTAVSPNVAFDGFPLPGSFTPGPNSGCAPFNVFGEGAPSQAALDFVFQDTLSTSKITQHVVSGYVVTDSSKWFELPGGPAGLLLGGEWRRETSDDNPNEFDMAGLTFGNELLPEFGEFEVYEGYVEVDLPILRDLPLIQNLNIDGALRVSDYTTVGTTLTWKAGLTHQVNDTFRLRGTIAEAVRAPNIGELFDPGGQTFQFINDPCDISNLSQGEAPRAANCATLLSGFGVDPATFVDLNSSSIAGTLEGNRTLSEETARTYTAGIVVTPAFIDGLTMSADFYDITIENAIITATPQALANLCVDSSSLDNQFCDQIVRDPTSGLIVDFTQQPLNVAQISTQGFDFTTSYRFDLADKLGVDGDWGGVNMRLVGNHLRKLDFINFPGDDVDSDLGESDADEGFRGPRWQLSFDATWRRGPLSANYGFTYFSRTLRASDTATRNDPTIYPPEFIRHRRLFTHDAQVRYDISDQFQVYVGANNIFDQEPDVGETFFPVSAVGRYVYAGFQANLGGFSDLNPF